MTRQGREVRVRYPAGPVERADFAVVEVEVADPAAGQVLVRNTWTSVGGDHLEAALHHLNRNGRVATCGSISEHESESRGQRDLFLAVSKDLTVRGFRASSNLHLMPEMQERMAHVAAEWRDRASRDGVRRSRSAPRALAAMIAGHTTGKTLVSIG